ncbi:MAG: hypothetical protein IJI01_04840 [Butyrivibrio sp.]|uniref:hypothetical protein n=1 Tax=Butyrivibrio sp. TaxID=28121 RepID=UPI0025B7B82C|nr:hypothetical protein [Butyrivibrio sp.]MBQ6587984.1 hypothetical protein [Butyrivibrio sp.]
MNLLEICIYYGYMVQLDAICNGLIIGLVEIALCGIVCGVFTGGPVILFGILGMKEAQNMRFDAAKKKYLIAKIAAIIGGFLWVMYMIGLLVLCYIINH